MQILIVEKEKESYVLLSSYLKQCCKDKITILYSKNGRDALKILQEKPINLLYTNVKMKDMTGFGLAKKAQELWPDVQIVFVEDTESYALEAIQMRVSDYIVKPITLEQVERTLSH